MSRSSIIYGVSIAVHAAVIGSLALIKQAERSETIAISVSEGRAKQEAPKANDPPPPPPEPVKEAVARPAGRPRPAAATPTPAANPAADTPRAAGASALDGLPDFGLSLGGGVGTGGIAVPAGGGQAPAPTADVPTNVRAPRAIAARPAEAECSEAPVKPKPKSVPQPQYSASAREAGVEGKVRVEVTVGVDGRVTQARVIAGLGHGLDEAALEAARRATFEPGTRCGKAASTTFVIAMRFSIG